MSLYPSLETSDGLTYRIQEITRLRKSLEDERDKRAALYKKYRRAVNALDTVDGVMLAASVGMGVGGVGLLTTIIAAPIVVALEIAALVCGVMAAGSKLASRNLTSKAKKHDEIRVLSEGKLSSIADLVSKALEDGRISDVEFKLITGEENKFRQMKNEIRSRRLPADLDEDTQKSLILKGRDEARAEFVKALGSK